MKVFTTALLLLTFQFAFSQSKMKLELNQAYRDVKFANTTSIMYSINLEAKQVYEFI